MQRREQLEKIFLKLQNCAVLYRNVLRVKQIILHVEWQWSTCYARLQSHPVWLPFMPRNPEKMRESLKEVLLPANFKIFNKPNIVAETLQHNTKIWDFVVHTRAFPSSVGKQILCLSILSQQAGRRTGLYKKDSMPNENAYGASVSKQLNVHHENRLQPYGFPLDLFSCLLCSVVKCQLIEEIFVRKCCKRLFVSIFLK